MCVPPYEESNVALSPQTVSWLDEGEFSDIYLDHFYHRLDTNTLGLGSVIGYLRDTNAYIIELSITVKYASQIRVTIGAVNTIVKVNTY